MPGFLNICDSMPVREDYPAGSGWSRSWNQAITFGGGAMAFGLSFDTKSGYSTNVKLDFETGAKYRAYWFCSDTNGGAPSWDSLRVFAGPNDL